MSLIYMKSRLILLLILRLINQIGLPSQHRHPSRTGKSIGNFRLWCETFLHLVFSLRYNLHGGQSPKPCAILPLQRTRDGGGCDVHFSSIVWISSTLHHVISPWSLCSSASLPRSRSQWHHSRFAIIIRGRDNKIHSAWSWSLRSWQHRWLEVGPTWTTIAKCERYQWVCMDWNGLQ